MMFNDWKIRRQCDIVVFMVNLKLHFDEYFFMSRVVTSVMTCYSYIFYRDFIISSYIVCLIKNTVLIIQTNKIYSIQNIILLN